MAKKKTDDELFRALYNATAFEHFARTRHEDPHHPGAGQGPPVSGGLCTVCTNLKVIIEELEERAKP